MKTPALLTLATLLITGCATGPTLNITESPTRHVRRAARPDAPATSKLPTQPTPIVGDFDAELRTPDDRFDTPRMIAALKRMGVNTYVYQIWHKSTDWDDLPAFATAAASENINVWVWIMPWSMTPPNKKGGRYSEPFQNDYVRWAQEIARLSLAHPNVVGYMIDDFYVNVQDDRFSPRYVKQMVDAGRAVNPKILCYPQLYFQQSWGPFVRDYGDLVDGVIVAYPQSAAEVDNALLYLNGEPYGPSFSASFPRREAAPPGDYAAVTADFAVADAADASLSFYWNHTGGGDASGARLGYVKVNRRVVWEGDCSSHGADKVVRIDLVPEARERRSVQIEIGVASHQRAKFPLIARADDILTTGLRPPAGGWTIRRTGEEIVPELTGGGPGGKRRLPLIVMVAAVPYEHELRYSEPGTARTIGRKMALASDLLARGAVRGVVTYCAPKDPADPIFAAVRESYESLRARP